MAATEEVWLPREVHNYDRGPTYRNFGDRQCWRGSLGIIQCYKWGQARFSTGPMLFSIFLSAIHDESFRDMGMASTYSPDRALTYSTSDTSDRRTRLLG